MVCWFNQTNICYSSRISIAIYNFHALLFAIGCGTSHANQLSFTYCALFIDLIDFSSQLFSVWLVLWSENFVIVKNRTVIRHLWRKKIKRYVIDRLSCVHVCIWWSKRNRQVHKLQVLFLQRVQHFIFTSINVFILCWKLDPHKSWHGFE